MSSQYYRITRRLGTPHRNSVTVTIPLVGPQGPAGPAGPKGDPGEVSGSIAWDNVTDKPSTFAPSSHTHTASQITDFTAAVEAVSPPADWDTLANKPSTFTPSAHGSTHHTGGTDAIAPNNISAAWALVIASNLTISADTVLTAGRNVQQAVSTFSATNLNLTLPTTGNATGDTFIVLATANSTGNIIIRRRNHDGSGFGPEFTTLATASTSVEGKRFTFRATNSGFGGWALIPVDTHGHVAADISDFTTSAAAAAPVASVAGRTGAITLAVADVSGAVADTDARLSDSRDPNAHAASHLPEGDDELFDQSLNKSDSVEFADITLNQGEMTISDSEISAYGRTVDFEDGLISGFGLEVNDQTFTVKEINDEGGKARFSCLNIEEEATRVFDFPDADGTIALTADIPDPSSATPQALGSASAGTSDDYSRGDHIHAAPALNDLSNVSAATPSDNDVLVFDTATSAWVAEAPSGGGSGEVRSDFVSPYTYTGLAAAGTSESTASWTIRRSEFDAGGSFVATLTASAVQWANRLTASYA